VVKLSLRPFVVERLDRQDLLNARSCAQLDGFGMDCWGADGDASGHEERPVRMAATPAGSPGGSAPDRANCQLPDQPQYFLRHVD
jgi:hypothetical protein